MLYNVIMKKEIRQPQQERSTEKKNKIIKAAYEVFSEVGYYNSNTAEIAKRASVSTGIVYSYFTDKKDILLYVLQIYIDNVTAPIEKEMECLTVPVDYKKVVGKIVDIIIKIHKDNSHLHNTLHALAANDKDINEEFISLETVITQKISAKLRSLGENIPFVEERVHLAMNLMQSFAHESVYDKHKYLDYSKMKEVVCDMVVTLFEERE